MKKSENRQHVTLKIIFIDVKVGVCVPPISICALPRAGACCPTYLGQAGVFVHHLGFVHRRQLLQDAPAVRQGPCQPRKLRPTCREGGNRVRSTYGPFTASKSLSCSLVLSLRLESLLQITAQNKFWLQAQRCCNRGKIPLL